MLGKSRTFFRFVVGTLWLFSNYLRHTGIVSNHIPTLSMHNHISELFLYLSSERKFELSVTWHMADNQT